MSLQQKITQDLLSAMKAKEESVVAVLRMLKSAIQNKTIEYKLPHDQDLDDSVVASLVKSEIKKRQDSANNYLQGGRPELAKKEQAEITILEQYLPEQLSEEEIARIISEKIIDLSASSPTDFGRVMGAVMQEVGNRADGQTVSQIIKQKLSQ